MKDPVNMWMNPDENEVVLCKDCEPVDAYDRAADGWEYVEPAELDQKCAECGNKPSWFEQCDNCEEWTTGQLYHTAGERWCEGCHDDYLRATP